MNPRTLPHALAAAALTAVAVAGSTMAAPAAYAEPTSTTVDCSDPALDEAVEAARADAAAAKAVFVEYRRPMGKLVKAERREAGVEAKAARAELRELAHADVKSMSKEERAELRAQVKAARGDLRAAKAALRASAKELRAVVKVERRDAKEAWDLAKVIFHDLRSQAQDCQGTDEPVDEPTTDEPGDEPITDEPGTDEPVEDPAQV